MTTDHTECEEQLDSLRADLKLCALEITRLRQENEKLQQQVSWLLDQVRRMKNDNP